jgi:cytoskeletal protein CcmA (bactofilin family)
MADVTMVGSGIFLRGSIRGEGDLEIRGRVEGDIEIVGEVIIADGALIKADVTARRITVRGAVLGNLTGEDGVRLEGGARVVGDVRGASIGISDGALLRGNVQTGQGEERARPRATQARAVAKPPARVEVRKALAAPPPPPVSIARNGVARKVVPTPVEEERSGPPAPVVPVLKKGARAALRKRVR